MYTSNISTPVTSTTAFWTWWPITHFPSMQNIHFSTMSPKIGLSTECTMINQNRLSWLTYMDKVAYYIFLCVCQDVFLKDCYKVKLLQSFELPHFDNKSLMSVLLLQEKYKHLCTISFLCLPAPQVWEHLVNPFPITHWYFWLCFKIFCASNVIASYNTALYPQVTVGSSSWQLICNMYVHDNCRFNLHLVAY